MDVVNLVIHILAGILGGHAAPIAATVSALWDIRLPEQQVAL
jgi:hypothetical protein